MTQNPGPEPLGPVEYLVFAFPGNRFTGAITPAVDELVRAGTVRIIDLAIVAKDTDGTVHILEARELSAEVAEALLRLTGEVGGLLSEADLDAIAEDLAPGSTAAALLVEHLWANRFARAIRAAEGELLFSARIPPQVVEEVRAGLLEAAAAQ